jgi:hypothetical protein
MKEIFKRLMEEEQDTLVALFSGSSLKSFMAGRLIAVDDLYIVIRAVAPDGGFDGYIVKRIADLSLVEQNSRSLQRIRFMEHEAGGESQPLPGVLDTADIARSILSIAQQNALVVSIGIDGCDVFVTGKVRSVNDTTVSILQIDERWGDMDGTAHLNLESMDHIEVLTQDCLRIELLCNKWEGAIKN